MDVQGDAENGDHAEHPADTEQGKERPRQIPSSREERDAELRRARIVQREMLPNLPDLPGMSLGTLYEPCSEIGGDFFDVFPVGPYEIGIVIGDVSGHGIDSALIMAMAKKTIQMHGQGRPSPRETLYHANSDLQQDLPVGKFVTVGYGILDVAKGCFRFVRAGHTPLYKVSRLTGEVETYEPPGMPIGISPNAIFKPRLTEETVNLEAGDTLVWVTDGVYEARNEKGEIFGLKRFSESISVYGDKDLEAATDIVKSGLDAFMGREPPHDDLTLLAFRFTGKPGKPIPRTISTHRTGKTNLSSDALPVFGREKETQELVDILMDPDNGIVTLRGPGGVGKTTLARRIGLNLLHRFPGGVWFVDLVEAESAPEVATAVAKALSAPVEEKDPGQAVANILEFRKPLLLILDNFEQVAESAGDLLTSWLKQAPQIKMLVTSRFSLNTGRERIYVLDPLPAPPKRHEGLKAKDVDAFDSVQLFLDRARRVVPDFTLTDENAPHVAAICEGLDGLPLAIELAAARTVILQPDEISERLDKKFSPLLSGNRSMPERHRTMKATIDFSFDLLTPVERAAFLQLSAFRGGVTLEAIEQVLSLDDPEAPMAMDLTQSLCQKSLLLSKSAPFRRRFSMFPIIREYAQGRLLDAEAGVDLPALHRRHAEYYAQYGEEWGKRLQNQDHLKAIEHLELELENLWTACDRMVEAGDGNLAARVLIGAHRVLSIRPRGDSFHGERLEGVLKILPADRFPEMRARVLSMLGHRLSTSDRDRAVALTKEAVELLAPKMQAKVRCDVWMMRGWTLRFKGEADDSCAALDRAISIAQDADLPQLAAQVRATKAIHRQMTGQADEDILPCLEEAETLCRQQGDLSGAARILNAQSIAHMLTNNHQGSIEASLSAIEILSELRGDCIIEHLNCGISYGIGGDCETSRYHFNLAEVAARNVGKKFGLMRVVLARAIVNLRDPKQRPLAKQDLDEAEHLARELGSPEDLGGTLEFRAKDAWLMGHYSKALRWILSAEAADKVSVSSSSGHSLERLATIASFHATMNEAQEAKAVVAEAFKKVPDPVKDFSPASELFYFALARAAHVSGDIEKAHEHAKTARDIFKARLKANPKSPFDPFLRRSLIDLMVEKALQDLDELSL
jgi:predicted ATPase